MGLILENVLVIFLVNRVCCLVYVYLFTMLCHEFICSEEVSVGTLHSEDLFFVVVVVFIMIHLSCKMIYLH